MPSTILVKDVIYRVSDQLLDTNTQFTRWAQRTLVNYLNDGQRAIAKYLPHSCSRADVIKLSAGTKQSVALVPSASLIMGDGSTAVDTRGNRLSGIVRNMGVDGATPGRAVRPLDRSSLDSADPNWHTKTGTYITGFVFDPQFPKIFYVTPGVPATTNLWVEIAWLPDPLDIPAGTLGTEYLQASADTTKLTIDDRNVDDLVNYMLARAEMRDAEFSGAAMVASAYANAFTSSINTQAVAAGLPNPKLQALPVAVPQG